MARLHLAFSGSALGLAALACVVACSKPDAAGSPHPTQAAAAVQAPIPLARGTDVETEVPVRAYGGTYVVPATINGTITLDFTIDSGASDVSIPADVASTLVRSGTITRDDFIGTQTYVLADGTQVPSAVFHIRTLKVGTLVLHDVTASLANAQSPLLLGQSFLRRMSNWSFDNARQVLKLKAAAGGAEAAPAADMTVATANLGAGAPGASRDAEALLTDSDINRVAGQFHRTYKSGGMSGVAESVTRCYAAIPNSDDLFARKAAAACVTLDLVGLSIDTEFRKEMQARTQREVPATPFYETAALQLRMQTYLPLTTPAHTMPPISVFRDYEQNAEQKLTVLLDAEGEPQNP